MVYALERETNQYSYCTTVLSELILPGSVHVGNCVASLAVLWLGLLQQNVIEHSSHVDTHLK